jgi:hypothetical protein
LFDVVLVQGECELLLGSTHAVGTVLTGGSIAINTTTVGVATHGAKQLGVLARREIIGHDATGGIVHALTQVDVSARGQRGSLGRPFGANSRAALQSGVGRSV